MKGEEPEEWKEYRQTPGAGYEAKKCLREALYKEQGGICAYCMQRLDNELKEYAATSNRIEHIQSREKHDDLKLIYTNMVMCCKGLAKEKEEKKINHIFCDRKKESDDIHFSPLDSTFINSLSYNRSNGKIATTNAVWQGDMDIILNLNDRLLMANRLAALKAIKQELGTKQWKASKIKKMIEHYDNRNSGGLYQPFCGMIVWYLKKKLEAYGILSP